MTDLQVVNIVGSGEFDIELDLASLSISLGDVAKYEPEIYPAMYLRVCGKDGPLMTIYRTGKFIIAGVDTEDQLYDIKEKATTTIADTINQPLNIKWFKIQNFVCKGDIGRELDLNTISIDLGLAQTEYEPEQFPGMIYRSNSDSSVVLVFGSGKVVVTGATSESEAENAYSEIVERIERLFK